MLFIPAALFLSGCGGKSAPPRPAICLLKAQQAVASDLGVSSAAIHFRRSVGSNGMPQCAFSVRAAGRRAVVIVNVDNGPSAYFRLLRTVDEATQVFGPPPPGFHPPQTVAGLGSICLLVPEQRSADGHKRRRPSDRHRDLAQRQA